MSTLRELQEPTNNLNSNTKELPQEYVKRAQRLIEKKKQEENELRKSQKPVHGCDDRLNGALYKLDIQLSEDLAKLRKEYGLD